jgi:hypothetical protein
MVDGKKKKEQCMEKGQVAMPIHHGPYQHGCGVVTCDLSRWPTLSQYILTYILVVTLWSLCDRASLCYLFPLHVAEVWYSHIGCIKSLGISDRMRGDSAMCLYPRGSGRGADSILHAVEGSAAGGSDDIAAV